MGWVIEIHGTMWEQERIGQGQLIKLEKKVNILEMEKI